MVQIMKTSKRGIALIKQFEGCELTAYKALPTEKFWTIGYGHYSPDIKPGTVITQAKAEEYLKSDLLRFEASVDNLKLRLNQNQFDALVSFAYNCGTANLRLLCRNRTLSQIADAMLLYNKANGKVHKGLTNRRKTERALFLEEYKSTSVSNDLTNIALEVIEGKWGNGAKRKDALTANGYDYKAVQREVNRILRGELNGISRFST